MLHRLGGEIWRGRLVLHAKFHPIGVGPKQLNILLIFLTKLQNKNASHVCIPSTVCQEQTQHNNSSAQCDLLLAMYIEQRNQTALCHVIIGGG